MLEAIIVAIFALAGVITQRVVGFGIAPFLSPIALIFFAPPIAVVTTLFVGTLSCLIILFQTRHRSVVIPNMVLRLVVGAIPGLLIGAYIVTRIDKSILQVILGVVVIVAILIQEYALPKPTRALGATRGVGVAGFFSGLLNASAANGAPPMVLWLRTHKSTPDQIRQNMVAMFIAVNLCSLTAIYNLRPETYDAQLAATCALLIPVVIIGNAIGGQLMKQVNVKIYEKLVVIAVIFTGLVSILLGLTS